MKMKSLITSILIVFVAASLVYLVVKEAGSPADLAASAESEVAAPPAHKVIAYYFHGFQRCKTCLHIEALAKQTIEESFPQELKDGLLEWKVVNFEEEANTEMASHYELVASSLVLVDFRDGKEQQWKNLEQVWDLAWDDEAFADYVRKETWNYLYADQNDG